MKDGMGMGWREAELQLRSDRTLQRATSSGFLSASRAAWVMLLLVRVEVMVVDG
jgi:hypothetical protein